MTTPITPYSAVKRTVINQAIISLAEYVADLRKGDLAALREIIAEAEKIILDK